MANPAPLFHPLSPSVAAAAGRYLISPENNRKDEDEGGRKSALGGRGGEEGGLRDRLGGGGKVVSPSRGKGRKTYSAFSPSFLKGSSFLFSWLLRSTIGVP